MPLSSEPENPQVPTEAELVAELVRAERIANIGEIKGSSLAIRYEALRGPALNQREVMAIAKLVAEKSQRVISTITVHMGNGEGTTSTYAVSDSKHEALFN